MITTKILRFISDTFIGNLESNYYSYKSGPQIHDFFQKYFGYENTYWAVRSQPSRWQIGIDKLTKTIEENKFNKFFSIILGIPYLNVENKGKSVDQLAEIRKNIIAHYNQHFKDDGYKLLDINNTVRLIKINEDLEFVGSGGFAEVYRIKSKNIIVKKLKEENYISKSIVSRFKREYNITKSLSDIDGVIKVYELDENDLSYTMEKAEMDLNTYINSNSLNFNNKMVIIFQILNVMEKVHEREIIHRDISPSNILLFSGLFKMADFGLGKDLSIFNSHQTLHTNSYGQFDYCDPRQFMTLKEGDKYSDIYSIGKVINFIFTKDPRNTDHEFKVITEKACSNDELARFATIKEMSNAIKKLLLYIQSGEKEEKVFEKIQNNELDEIVIDYLQVMDYKKIFFNLKKHDFRLVFTRYFELDQIKSRQFEILNGLYNEMTYFQDKRYEDLDPLGYFSINVIKSESDFPVKEAAVDILNYIIDSNRWEISKRVKQLIDNGIEPLLEEKFDLEKLSNY